MKRCGAALSLVSLACLVEGVGCLVPSSPTSGRRRVSRKRPLGAGFESSHSTYLLGVSSSSRLQVLRGSADADDTDDTPADFDDVGLDEVQLLLACRAYLIRKHKVEWKGKKRRSEDAASPSNQLGYFWPGRW